MRQRRGELLILTILGILVIITSVLSVRNEHDRENDWLNGSTYSQGEIGTRALYLWLDELGYETQTLESDDFLLQNQDIEGVLWVITPSRQPLTQYDAKELSDWVHRGGTLVWIDSYFEETWLEKFELESHDSGFSTFHPVTPWLRHSDVAYRGSRSSSFVPSGHVTPLLADASGNLGALHLLFGEGEAWFFILDRPFKNISLHEEKNSALVMGLLEQLPPNQPMIFDEFHHGFRGPAGDWSLLRTMRQTYWGWAIYYTAILFALWLLLHGRQFGRPIPLPGEHLRREAGEYIRSMAWLYRRAHLRSFILRHHHHRLKQRVTKRYRLPATSDDAAFLHVLPSYLPNLDYPALREHLLALRNRQPSEQEVLALARANDEWLEEML